MTPSEHGAYDFQSWIDDQTINNPNAVPSKLASEALAKRSGSCDPDEALINAMGRSWILNQIGLDDTDENWAGPGLEWCKAYNAGYWATAEALAGTC